MWAFRSLCLMAFGLLLGCFLMPALLIEAAARGLNDLKRAETETWSYKVAEYLARKGDAWFTR